MYDNILIDLTQFIHAVRDFVLGRSNFVVVGRDGI